MVPTAHVEPPHPGQNLPKPGLHRRQRALQRVGVLLAEGVKVQPVQQRQQAGGHGGVPLGAGHPQAAAGGAGIVELVALLGGAFGVHPQPHLPARRFGCRAKFRQLVQRIEHNMVGILQQFAKFVVPVGGAEHMDLFSGHFLCAQAGLIQAAGLGARQVPGEQGIAVIVGERLLGQQNPASGALCHPGQKFAVAAQRPFVQQIAGGGQGGKQPGRVLPAQGGKGRAALGLHPSTSAGARFTRRGRPYRSSASRKGSGSNSSTVWTPGAAHWPVSSISAPHMAGTPVV